MPMSAHGKPEVHQPTSPAIPCQHLDLETLQSPSTFDELKIQKLPGILAGLSMLAARSFRKSRDKDS